ncbi:hypothetical protein DQ04_05791030 [Trypanosoma grayi]|uniref:hypothetical protein n=1 Tax=Trypanosoma grayi TaxID=71804 RepID=UPI0004F44F78|nr:hypothetical protein DQ04_05791030 [Trypanosoma grayi]KEG09111.1 hypothetical protein DQ04_05791030 [Trypanosoma grayi]
MLQEDFATRTDSNQRSQTESTIPHDELLSSVESERTFFAPLAEGESYARQIMEKQWFRGMSSIKGKAELELASISMLQKHGFGGRNASEDGQEEEGQQGRRNTTEGGMQHDRKRGEFLYRESTERIELERDEHFGISVLQLIMEEDLERIAMEEEAFVRLQLVCDVMRPKIRWRYIFAWGIMKAVASPPSWSEMERIRPTQRQKPAYLRVPPPTCPVPIEPNPFWEPWEGMESTRLMIQMGSEA